MGSGPSDGTRSILSINLADNAADASDWKAPIINYLCNLSIRMDNNVRCTTFKYILIEDELLPLNCQQCPA
jgi:hypothetical protein